jgi:hypothetical protein
MSTTPSNRAAKLRACTRAPRKSLLGAAKGKIEFHSDLNAPTLPNRAADSLYRAAPLGRSTGSRTAADHDRLLYKR